MSEKYFHSILTTEFTAALVAIKVEVVTATNTTAAVEGTMVAVLEAVTQ